VVHHLVPVGRDPEHLASRLTLESSAPTCDLTA
jgi:hypothetical protein